MNWEDKFLNKIVNGDCLQLLPQIPDNSIDLVVTSPPYNCGIDYDSYDDNKTWEEYLEWSKKWLVELKRVLKKDGRICLNVPVEMGLKSNNKNRKRVSPFSEFYRLFNEVGINYAGVAIWTDDHRVINTAWGSWKNPSCPYIYNAFEVIMMGYKENWAKEKKGIPTISRDEFISSVSGVWNLRTQTQQITKANFSSDLPERCIKLLSYKDDIVLDPFSGSGTTAKVAKLLHRNFIALELSEKYTKISQNIIDSTIPLLEEFLIEEEVKKEVFKSQTFDIGDL
jgi:site-specific DNA-methyltransferase (adenine-specific)